MGKQAKRALADASASAPKKQKKQTKRATNGQDQDEGEDVECASLGFADALSVGLAFAQLGAQDSAIEAFERAVSLEPRHYNARCQLADACAECGDHATALTHYAAASELEEAAADATLWLRLGMAQASTDDNDAALASYTKARDLAQQQLMVAGDAGQTKEDLRRAYGMALAALANVLGVEKEEMAAAVKVYEDAVAAFPLNANLHFNLATMRLANGERESAVADLRRAIALDDSVVEFYEELVELLDGGDERTAMEEKMAELRRASDAKGEEEETKEGEEEEEEDGEEEEENEAEDEEDNDESDEDE